MQRFSLLVSELAQFALPLCLPQWLYFLSSIWTRDHVTGTVPPSPIPSTADGQVVGHNSGT